MKKIVSLGRGGVGKSTFIALLAKYLKDSKPLLLVDADPDQNLAEMLGLDLEKEKVKTVSEIIFEVKEEVLAKTEASFPFLEKVEYLFQGKGLYEGKGFDLFSLGTKWTQGCYCQPNNILKDIISRLEKNYLYTLIDSPAGLEHLNRRITSKVDDIFAIIDPSQKAFDNLKRSSKIIKETGISYDNFYIVSNYRFPQDLESSVEERTGLPYLGKIDYDERVEKENFLGKSLFEIPESSPAFLSLKKILKKVGY
jgi:CO dehydrogenase maturation factor